MIQLHRFKLAFHVESYMSQEPGNGKSSWVLGINTSTNEIKPKNKHVQMCNIGKSDKMKSLCTEKMLHKC